MGPTLNLAIGAVAYTSLRVHGKRAPPSAVPIYITVATAVTARVYVVYPGTKLYTYAKTKPPRIRKITCAVTGVWVLGLHDSRLLATPRRSTSPPRPASTRRSR